MEIRDDACSSSQPKSTSLKSAYIHHHQLHIVLSKSVSAWPHVRAGFWQRLNACSHLYAALGRVTPLSLRQPCITLIPTAAMYYIVHLLNHKFVTLANWLPLLHIHRVQAFLQTLAIPQIQPWLQTDPSANGITQEGRWAVTKYVNSSEPSQNGARSKPWPQLSRSPLWLPLADAPLHILQAAVYDMVQRKFAISLF